MMFHQMFHYVPSKIAFWQDVAQNFQLTFVLATESYMRA